MQITVQTPLGVFTSEPSAVRALPHPQGAIHIFDGLFQPEFIATLGQQLANLPFTASDYDNEQTKHILHMKCELPAQSLLLDQAGNLNPQAYQLAIIARICFDLLQRFYPEYQQIKLERAHVNSIPYGDFLIKHVDGPPQQVLTGLYFANAHWQQDWAGELIFADQYGESLYAIEFKPGRLLLFPGDILHRAGSPSRICFAHRLSVGYKFYARKS